MRNKTALSVILSILLVTLAGCTENGASIDSHDGGNTAASNTHITDELTENTTSSPEVHTAAVPAVFVNDIYFRFFDEKQNIVPDIDDTWAYLGNIQSSVPGWESPVQNFQTNNEQMIGAEIFHSSIGRIPITSSVWDDPLNEEAVGDSIIVVFNGQRILYISEEAHTEAYKVMSAVVRHSLMIDEIIYSFMGSGNGVILNSYTYLGETTSAVPINEFPTKNLQSNREIVVGMRAYRLPPEDNNDIIVIYTDSYFFYKHLP